MTKKTFTQTLGSLPSVLLLFPTLLLAACGGMSGGGNTVDVTIAGGAGKTIRLDRTIGRNVVTMDSVALDANGKGSLSTAHLPLDFYYLNFDRNNFLILALDSSEGVQVVARAEELAKASSITGSKHAKALFDFFSDSQIYRAKRDSVRTLVNNGGDQTAMDAFNKLNAEHFERCKRTVMDNPGSPVQLAAIAQLDPTKEPELVKQVREQIGKVMGNTDAYADFNGRFAREEQMQAQQQQQQQQMEAMQSQTGEGAMAPEINQPSPDGGMLALSSLRGKVVLIDFWASWCKPCIAELPNVKAAYSKYKSKGFEIYGVSFDRSREAWVNAIQQHDLPWKHVSDLGFWNNAAAAPYGVQSIPQTVLIDKEGKIIAKNLRGPMLEQKLAQVFGS
ncbi:MAG: TlpA disulfide reductase family protein [Flavobacteriales bacterium]